ncbi:MAG: hypothetical protein ACTIKE_12100 [Sphingobacterium sp.]
MIPKQRYPIYKGLQKPLVYRGFKGKFIFWGIGSIFGGLLLGGLVGAFTNMYIGCATIILAISAGLGWTYLGQKNGLHSKTRHRGIFINPSQLPLRYKRPPKP